MFKHTGGTVIKTLGRRFLCSKYELSLRTLIGADCPKQVFSARDVQFANIARNALAKLPVISSVRENESSEFSDFEKIQVQFLKMV